MQGMLRFILALMVVFEHLGGGGQLGMYAVFGFYVTSGYLITAALNDVYKFDLKRFSINRFLRLYPIYYVVALASLLILATHRYDFASQLNARLNLQNANVLDIFGAFTLAPYAIINWLVRPTTFSLVPPTWSVAVEIVCYGLLWAFIARSKHKAIFSFIIAAIYQAATIRYGLDPGSRYYPAAAALMPFSIGALTYFFRDSSNRFGDPWFWAVAALWALHALLYRDLPAFDLHAAINLALFSAMLFLLTEPSRWRKLASVGPFLGDLAYPIFLVHWIVGSVVAVEFFDSTRSPYLALASLPFILAISVVLVEVGDILIEPLRSKVRGVGRLSGKAAPSNLLGGPDITGEHLIREIDHGKVHEAGGVRTRYGNAIAIRVERLRKQNPR